MNSFIGWIGGKSQLRTEIISRFPEKTPDRYVEVFGGAGWVLFGKEQTSKQLEVFNDIDSNLINLFRCVKYHREELQRELSLLLHSRELFFTYIEQMRLPGLTDIQRAARYLYTIKSSFGNKKTSFRTASTSYKNTAAYLEKVEERLKGVVIENADFEQLIKCYDRPNALFYLDPPYLKAEKYYDYVFTLGDHHRLKACLEKIKGRFILSYNNEPVICELYSDFHIEHINRRESLSGSGKNTGLYREVIIRNY